jgi:hypothetical protein
MIATQDEEVFGVLDLVCKKQANGLERLLASVDIVSKEKIVCLRGEASVLEQTEQIIVLAMDVTADLRARDWVSVGTSEEIARNQWQWDERTLIGASSSSRMG